MVGHDLVNFNGMTINAPIEVSFHDAATFEPAVPDNGSTFGLLALASAGLFGASRFRSLRLA
jgi:hypothetical protein